MSRFRVVKGRLPKVVDFDDWDDPKIYKMVKFIDFFMDGKKMDLTPKKRQEMESIDDPYFEEFLVRIDSPSDTPIREDKFKMRFITMTRTFLGYLKRHPHLITDEIYDILSKSQRMSWAAQAFTMKNTDIGGEVVAMHTDETTDPGIKNVSPMQTNPQAAEVQYNQAVLAMATALKDITKGIKREDLKRMKIEDRLKIANSIIVTLQKTFQGYKPNIQVFKQLNIHNATKEQLEQGFMEYNENQ